MTQKSIFSNKVGHPVKAKAQSKSLALLLHKKSRIQVELQRALLGEGTFHPLPLLPACSFIIFECFMTKQDPKKLCLLQKKTLTTFFVLAHSIEMLFAQATISSKNFVRIVVLCYHSLLTSYSSLTQVHYIIVHALTG